MAPSLGGCDKETVGVTPADLGLIAGAFMSVCWPPPIKNVYLIWEKCLAGSIQRYGNPPTKTFLGGKQQHQQLQEHQFLNHLQGGNPVETEPRPET